MNEAGAVEMSMKLLVMQRVQVLEGLNKKDKVRSISKPTVSVAQICSRAPPDEIEV